MAASWSHVLSQGPVLRALGAVALRTLAKKQSVGAPTVPSAWIERELPPRPEGLIRDFVRAGGGDPSWYRGVVPAHLFPQWAFALGAELLQGVPYPLARALNGGASLEQRRPLPAGEPLLVRARLASIDDDGSRAVIAFEVVTGTKSAPDALRAEMRTFIPLGKSVGKGKRAPVLVPEGARELSFGRLREDAGLDFAKLTGDFNPIHWVPAAARAAGFRNVILHGFGTLARAAEALGRSVFAGDPTRLGSLDVRFVRPLVLPASVGVYALGERVWVGDAPLGTAYLEGTFASRENGS